MTPRSVSSRFLAGLPLVAACAAPLIAQSSRSSSARARANDPIVWPDEGPTTWPPRATTSAITANDLRSRLYPFSDDSMQGRRIGELGNYKGTAYVAREFARLGLRPAGENGTYFQELPFGRMTFDTTSLRLLAAGAPLALRTDWIPVVPSPFNGFGNVADLSGVPVVFAGRWSDSTVALDSAAFRGKIAVFTATAAQAGLAAGGRAGQSATLQRCDSLPDRFGAQAAIAAEAAARAAGTAGRGGRGGRGLAFGLRDTRAQVAGARAIILVALDSAAPSSIRAALAGQAGMRPDQAAPPGIPGAVISSAAAARLFGKPLAQLAVGEAGQSVSMGWTYSWHMSGTPARNVIAILPGSDPARAGEYVMVSAHNDHVGMSQTAVDHDSLRAVNTITRRQGANDPVCRPTPAQQHEIDSLIARARRIRPPRRDSVMNGADDDGSGTVVLLEIAEKFAAEKPARSILFVSHTGEEGGLLGSRWFTSHPTVPLDRIVAAHNMDMVGKGRAEQVKFGGPASLQSLGSRRLSREFGDIIDSVNATRSEVMAIDKTWDVTANPMNRFCRSDQVNYVLHDVPVTYFSLGYAQDYHQPTDEARYIDYEHAARVGRFIHDVMLAIADRPTKPAIAGPDPAYPRCG